MKLYNVKRHNPGDKKEIGAEERIQNLDFNVFKFNNRPKPPTGQVLIICCFSEFGCEVVIKEYTGPNKEKRFNDKNDNNRDGKNVG